jgi:hypothetical protein
MLMFPQGGTVLISKGYYHIEEILYLAPTTAMDKLHRKCMRFCASCRSLRKKKKSSVGGNIVSRCSYNSRKSDGCLLCLQVMTNGVVFFEG